MNVKLNRLREKLLNEQAGLVRGTEFYRGYNEAILDIIEDIEILLKETDWIPVTERLPEDEKVVLVTTANNVVMVDAYMNYGWVSGWNVTAWQPLPEPYKPESK